MTKRTFQTTSTRAEEGYLLVETLVASSLLLFSLLAVMPLYTFAMKQNAFAKDVTVASSLALDKVEDFARWKCDTIRRGTCCFEPNNGASALTGIRAGCQPDDITVENIVYRRTCKIKQHDADVTSYSNAATHDDYDFKYAGMAWIEVTVTPDRSSHFNNRARKPSLMTFWRVCNPTKD